MTATNKNKKEAAPFEVATAKMPPWLFAELEEFKDKNNLQTRNAALNILILTGLSRWGVFGRDECLEFIRSQGMTAIPDSILAALPPGQEAI